MFDVITIGSSTVDFFTETELPVIPWNTPFKKAMAISLGEKFSVRDSFITSGGNAINAAVTFCRQGLKTAVVAKIGEDVLGKIILNRLTKEGIEKKFIVSNKSVSTSYSIILLRQGERSILSYHGAGGKLSISDFNFNNLKAKWWYVSLPGSSYKLFPDIVKKAKEIGVKLAFNPSAEHIHKGKKQILSNLKYIDFIVLNEGEASALTDIDFQEEKKVFKKLDSLMPGIAVVTRGSKGSYVSNGKYILKAGIFNEKKMTDRTGAGDAYGSGFVSGLIYTEQNSCCVSEEDKLKYAVCLATANAFSVVQKIGASENVLNKKDFDKNIARYKKLKIDINKA